MAASSGVESGRVLAVLETYRVLALEAINDCHCRHNTPDVFHQLIKWERLYHQIKATATAADPPLAATDATHDVDEELVTVLSSYRRCALDAINGCQCRHRSASDVFAKLIQCERDYHLVNEEFTKTSDNNEPLITGDGLSAAATHVMANSADESKPIGGDNAAIDCDYKLQSAMNDTKAGELSDNKSAAVEAKVDLKLVKKLPIDDIKCVKMDIKVDIKSDVKHDLKTDIKTNIKTNIKTDIKTNVKTYSKIDVKSDNKSIDTSPPLESEKLSPTRSDTKPAVSCPPKELIDITDDTSSDDNTTTTGEELPKIIATEEVTNVLNHVINTNTTQTTERVLLIYKVVPLNQPLVATTIPSAVTNIPSVVTHLQSVVTNISFGSNNNRNPTNHTVLQCYSKKGKTPDNDNYDDNSAVTDSPLPPPVLPPQLSSVSPEPVVTIKKRSMFKCAECPKKFRFEKKLKLHVKLVHTKRLACTLCDFKAVKANTLAKHHAKNHSYRPLTGQKPSQTDSLLATEKTVSDKQTATEPTPEPPPQPAVDASEDPYLTERPFVCHTNGCNAAFKTRDALKVHKSSGRHLTQRTCRCGVCGKTFFNNHSLSNHKRQLHSGKARPVAAASVVAVDENTACTECHKRFRSVQSLLKHVRTVHVALEFGCESCDFKTHVKYELNRHRRLSHPELNAGPVTADPFRCLVNGCPMVFAAEHELIQHKKDTHWRTDVAAGDAEQFACDWPQCTRRFVSVEKLDKHKRLHSLGKISTERMPAKRPSIAVDTSPEVFDSYEDMFGDSAEDTDDVVIEEIPQDMDEVLTEEIDSSDDELEVVFESLANK
ncbi:unnamed protein product [Medioppia subpectinata]|uniref:C2H2-type domain-containing protein n=1 Tax=Medioppia subpectinata TaxID=1979941 RepID=A0A7R9L267_9ACAR|nr:unnamed protein product [Medioppia subpectinata]CAG2113926.1 unnamed protein product [Medioppia subpectinata]